MDEREDHFNVSMCQLWYLIDNRRYFHTMDRVAIVKHVQSIGELARTKKLSECQSAAYYEALRQISNFVRYKQKPVYRRIIEVINQQSADVLFKPALNDRKLRDTLFDFTSFVQEFSNVFENSKEINRFRNFI